MNVQALAANSWPKVKTGLIVTGFVGLFLGAIGGGVEQYGEAVVSTAVLAVIFGAYNQTLKHNNGILSGLLAGGIVGLFVSLTGLPVSRNINGVLDGALFGTLSGVIAGGVIGVITHARPSEDDRWGTKVFLVVGSIGLGALLGGGVGLVAGVILGLISASLYGAIGAALAGGIVGAYLGSYFHKIQWIVLVAVVVALIAAGASLAGGALAGLVLGIISGSFAPMLFVALIGAYGGLFSRGPAAMLIEALEAPSEMLAQGAVPFLVPAMMVGMMVGTASSGVGSLIVLSASLAVVGLVLGVFGELEGKPNNQVTVRTIVEMTMMGAEDWPVRRAMRYITVTHRREALFGGAAGLLTGVLGSVIGILVGQLINQLVTDLLQTII